MSSEFRLDDFSDSDDRDDDLPTEDTLELIADILFEGTVRVEIYPEFLREVAEEIRALKKIIEEQRQRLE